MNKDMQITFMFWTNIKNEIKRNVHGVGFFTFLDLARSDFKKEILLDPVLDRISLELTIYF